MPESSFPSREQGLTLVELMIVLLIVGVLAGIALPSFVGLMERSRIESAASDLMSSLQLARSEAIQQNAHVRIVGLDADQSPDASANYANGWEVRMLPEADNAPTRVYAEGFPATVACANCVGEITFNGMGESLQSIDFEFVDGEQTRCIKLYPSGGLGGSVSKDEGC